MIRLFISRSIFILMCYLLMNCNGGNTGSTTAQNALGATMVSDSGDITPEEVRKIAKEAYIYGYPMIDGYRIQHTYFVDKDNTEYKAPYNVLSNAARVYTADDKVVQTPNSDTPYGMVGFDLRTEPFVITIPAMEKNRYFSIQLIDAYTHNFEYIGSRATGNDGGNYLIAGPDWKGELPRGIKKIIVCETQTALAIFRTQLFNPADLPNVANIQKKYKVQPLSAFLGTAKPDQAPAINFIKPVGVAELKTSLEYFNVLNFLLQFCPVHPSETVLRERFASIGIKPGVPFDTTSLKPEIKLAIEQGRSDAWKEFAAFKVKMDNKQVTSGDVFGTRDELQNNYLYRMAAAIIGIYGNSKKEAMYPIYTLDNEGASLDGTNAYTLTFSKNSVPPVNAFWSLTMYELPSSLLTKNPINRYLINSPMLSQLKKNADGGFTIHVQHESPGKAKEANWLPAPSGKFMMVLRLYWPKEAALIGSWSSPPLMKSK
jgi:hypothetical protein